jgi:CTP synthase (UTP-ammonia lyase)
MASRFFEEFVYSIMLRARIALVGDHSVSVPAHLAIPKALGMVAQNHGWNVEWSWISTAALDRAAYRTLAPYQAIWCVPGSPYTSEDGALRAIRYAREHDIPFLGTCGGCQHAILEYARNVLGLTNSQHAESNPSAKLPLISALSCSLVDTKATIKIDAKSRLYGIYGKEKIEEGYHCRYGLNPKLEHLLQNSELKICGRDMNGEVRAMELTGKRFYILTQFQPERAALEGRTPEVVDAFVSASAD